MNSNAVLSDWKNLFNKKTSNESLIKKTKVNFPTLA